jgi:hypothetical protein
MRSIAAAIGPVALVLLGCATPDGDASAPNDPPGPSSDASAEGGSPGTTREDAGRSRLDASPASWDAAAPKDAATKTDAGKSPLPSPFSLVVPDGFGVNTHVADSAPALMDMIDHAGFSWVRQDLPWSVIEQQKGVYDFAGIGFDALTAAWDQRGIRGLLILDSANPLYGPGNPVSVSQRQAFTSFVASAVSRYRGRGYLWEVWNEPEYSWAPADYAQLLHDVAATIHSVAPGELVVGPALGWATGTSNLDLGWLEAIFQDGALDDLSAVTLHPYLDQPESVFQDYQQVRDLIAKYAPGKPIPVFSGEWGFQTSTTGGVSDDVQAQMVTRVYLTNLYNGVPISIWYDWNDDGTDPANAEDNYGMVGPLSTLAPKPAYYAACNLSSLLGGYSLSRRVAAGDPNTDLVLRFERSGQSGAVFVGWVMQPGTSHTVTIPASELTGLPASIAVRGNTGDTLPTLSGGSDGLTVTIDNAPTYLLAK